MIAQFSRNFVSWSPETMLASEFVLYGHAAQTQEAGRSPTTELEVVVLKDDGGKDLELTATAEELQQSADELFGFKGLLVAVLNDIDTSRRMVWLYFYGKDLNGHRNAFIREVEALHIKIV